MNDDFVKPVGGYGRIWEGMYEGSMVGAGPEVFCLWPYVVTKMRQVDGVAQVMLNPDLLRVVFGVDDVEFVRRGIAKLCEGDESSKNGKENGGRRLYHISGYCYGVTNGARYMAIRAKDRHAEAQARYRDRQRRQVQGKGRRLTEAEHDERRERKLDRVDELNADREAEIKGVGDPEWVKDRAAGV